MSMKKEYTCDICCERVSTLTDLIGIRFTNMKNFTLDTHDSTDGVHICRSCAKQLKHLLEGVEL